jgi:hypothetical protein
MIAAVYTPNFTVEQRVAIGWVRQARFSDEYIKRVWWVCQDYFDRDYGFYTWCVAKAYDEHYRKVGK